jgi:glycosyltransferase involved in cell wall biosynthesis
LKLLAFAYACEPAEGSEPGAGWMWARMLARFGDTWILTRENNRERIESAVSGIPEGDALHFVYVDLPPWARFWKRGPRGLRLYYLLWQMSALRHARRLHRSEGFDVVWHLTLANAWLGSSASLVGPPFVFGPVGGGVKPPWRLVPPMGTRATVYELSRAAGRTAGRYLNPLARLAWRRALTILALNQETIDWLPRRHRHKARVFPNGVLSSLPDVDRPAGDRPRTALFAGRLLAWKGADLAIRVVAMLPDWRLLICGKGPDERRLRRLAVEAGVADRTVFAGWLPRSEVQRLMQEEAGVFLFPSLHDDSPWAIVEALAADLPILCLNRGGPPLLGDGWAIACPVTGGRQAVTARLAGELEMVRMKPMGDGRDLAREFHIDRRSQRLAGIVDLLAAP